MILLLYSYIIVGAYVVTRRIYPALIDYSYNLVTTCKDIINVIRGIIIFMTSVTREIGFYDFTYCGDKFNFVKILYNLIESLISETEIQISNVTHTELIYYFIIQYIIHIIKYVYF